MKIHQIAAGLALAASTAFCQAPGAMPSATETRNLLQAFAGFNQPNNLGLPCASPCLGLPAGTVIVQPNHFVSSNSAGLYYAVFQANGWTGDLSVAFSLSEAGTVVQTLTLTGSISSEQAYSPVVLSGSAIIPQGTFVGPATLVATTAATPTSGTPFTMKSSATMEVGGAGTRRVVLAFVGISAANSSGFPCAAPQCGLPDGSVGVQPAQFQATEIGPNFYAVFQADGWLGELSGTAEVTQAGQVVFSIPVSGIVGDGQEAYGVVLATSGGYGGRGAKPGPATLTVSTTAIQRTGNQFTLGSSAPVLIR